MYIFLLARDANMCKYAFLLKIISILYCSILIITCIVLLFSTVSFQFSFDAYAELLYNQFVYLLHKNYLLLD